LTGNPNGRPKGSRIVSALLQEILEQNHNRLSNRRIFNL
jgi:hypothetical protein